MSERLATYIANNVYYVDFGHGASMLRPQWVSYNNQASTRAKVIPIAKKTEKGGKDD